ncbi:MAG: NAD-dependent epimerase/dehydratase family protein [bacterium]
MKTKKKYFVTGGTGFIGSHLIQKLLKKDHQVVALARNLKKAEPLKAMGVELAFGDITDRSTLKKPMQGVDGIFHLAAWYKIGVDSSPAEPVNVKGTENVLTTMQELNIPKGVYTSTLAVNSDTDGQIVDETYRFQGQHLSAYDKTKWKAHYEVAVPLIRQGLPLIIVLPGLVYGPGDTSQLGELLQQAVKGKLNILPGGRTGVCWSHIQNIVQAHLLAMEKGTPGETYIIAGPCHTYHKGFKTAGQVTGQKIRALWIPPWLMRMMSRVMSIIEKIIPVPATFSAEAMRVTAGITYYGDNSKAKRELGYTPRSLEQGLRDTFVNKK